MIEINNTNNYSKLISFKSRNCPIKPFTIETATGKILFAEEMTPEDLSRTAKFHFNTIVEDVQAWKAVKNSSKKQKAYYLKYLENAFACCYCKGDGNSTILIAKDSKGRIKGLTDLQYYDEIDFIKNNGFLDLKTGYIQNCFIAPEYRNQGIGGKLIDKTLETVQDHFTDVLLISENQNSTRFYERKGFTIMDTSNPVIKKLVDFIHKGRGDNDNLIPMSKSFDIEHPWWQRMSKLLK